MLEKIVGAFVTLGRSIVGVLGWLGRSVLKLGYWVLVIGIPIGLIWYVVGVASLYWQYSDKDEYRGAASINADDIDQAIAREQIRYLDQNWTQSESLWFYNISQGSNLLPYDFFMALEQKGSEGKFREDANINKYRYLPQVKTRNNPDALAVGMVKDRYAGKDYMGFSCAACHTSQINYGGIGIRIDGAPASADLETFLIEMVEALEETAQPTKEDSQKRNRFYKAVLADGNYANEQEIDEDLATHIKRLKTYVQINEPVWPEGYAPQITQQKDRMTHYGFARLDAFGRIYNRVLQHVMDIETITEILEDNLLPEMFSRVKGELTLIKESSDQTDIVVRVLEVVEPELVKLGEPERAQILKLLRSKIYNPANAPASYPYLWDISQHDYVQWTGLVSNAGLGPLGRNVGQVMGVFGTLEWQKKPEFWVAEKFGGQGPGETSLDFKSSINKVNLRRVENQLRTLQSPKWPNEYLPAIDETLLDDGENVFNEYCVACHQNIKRDDPTRRVIAHIVKQTAVATDPVLAMNTIGYQGYSGLAITKYVDGSLGKLVIQKKMPVASIVKFTSQNVVKSPDPDRLVGFRSVEWLWGIWKSLRDNPVKQTARQGNYDLPTPQQPLAPLNGYKARALNGIWATAPYLHNGSIPNLYELLLPKKKLTDLELDEFGNKIEYRSDTFIVGSREFDPINVGFKSKDYKGFVYNTDVRGNSNAGHEYAAGRTAQPNGVVLAPLTLKQRTALLEYLKYL